ncbi:MAG: hypothetical protein WBG30_13210 [Psychrilyobacter sp.]
MSSLLKVFMGAAVFVIISQILDEIESKTVAYYIGVFSGILVSGINFPWE